MPLYRGTDPNRGLVKVVGEDFVCPGEVAEKLVIVHFMNGEVHISEEQYVYPEIGPDGMPTNKFKVEVNLLNHINALNGINTETSM